MNTTSKQLAYCLHNTHQLDPCFFYTFLFFLYGVTDQKGSSVYIYQENLVDIQSNL